MDARDRGVPISADQLLSSNRRQVVLLGEPGSGKTTLARYFAVKLARGEAGDLGLPSGEDWFPILIYLRDWAKNSERSLITQLETFAKDTLHVDDLPEGFFQHYLDGRSLILLDGLDEVIDAAIRKDLVEKLECALGKSDRNAAIITSRPWGYRRDYFDFAHFELERFDDTRIDRFIENWYRSRFESEADARTMIANLQESLEKNDRVRQLVRNPLLLTIVVLIHRYQDDLPKRRHQLYDRAVNTLLKSWDRTAKGLGEQQKNFFKVLDIDDDLRRVMSFLARWIHEQYETKTSEGGTIVREADLLRQLSAIIRDDYDIKPHKAEEEAKRFVEFIRDRAGLINEYGRGLYGFVHKTFQEYLTAEAIQSEVRERYDFDMLLTFIKERLHKQHWREVILLLVSQQEGKSAIEAVKTIWKAGSEYESWLHRDLLLAGECLTEDPPRLRKADQPMVGEILDELVDLAASNEEFVGSRSRQRAVNLLHRLRNTQCQDEALEKIKGKKDKIDRWELYEYRCYLGEKKEVITELLNLLQELDSEVRARAAFALGILGKNFIEVQQALLLTLEDRDAEVRERTAFALGLLGNISSEIWQNSLQLLQTPNPDIRRSIILGLTYSGLTSLEVKAALHPLLQDLDLEVRVTVLNVLERLGHNFSDVRSILLPLLQNSNSEMRIFAVFGLGKLNLISSEVKIALLPLLQDSDLGVRHVVASTLLRTGQSSPEIQQILFDSLQHLEGGFRLQVALELGLFDQNSSELMATLFSSIQDPDASVRKNAASALGQLELDSDEVKIALLSLLQNPDASVRLNAAQALCLLKQNSLDVWRVLFSSLQNPEREISRSATEALEKVGKSSPAVLPELVQWMRKQPPNAELGYAIDVLGSILEG
jgi:HEAT repeat protein